MHSRHGMQWLLATLLLPLATASAEYFPPPTLEELANAPVIVQGRYKVSQRGEPEFVIERLIAGSDFSASFVGGNGVRVKDSRSDTITCEVASAAMFGFQPSGMTIDAMRSRLWFRGIEKAHKIVPPGQIDWVPMVEPKELADGFLAVRNKQPPSLLFRVLQAWDANMRRDALEEIVAGKGPRTLQRLQEIAANPQSDAAGTAIEVLLKMKLFDADRHWDHWPSHPYAYYIGNELARLDRARMTRQLTAALRKAKDDAKLSSLLPFAHLIPDDELLPALAPLMKHKSATIRGDITRLLGNRLAQFHHERHESAAAEARFVEFERAVVPLFKQRIADDPDRHVRLYAQRALDTYEQAPYVPEPLVYRAEDNFELLVDQLTSHTSDANVRIRRAGQELARHELDAAFAEMKKRLVADEFNHDMVMDGFGFLCDSGKMPADDRCLNFIREHLRTNQAGASTFPAAVRAAARLNQKESLAVIRAAMEQNKQHLDDIRAPYYLDALAELDDPAAVEGIQKLKPHTQYRTAYHYLLALARHNDTWAIDELLRAAQGRADETMLNDARWTSQAEIINALRYIDRLVATGLMKRAIVESWPTRARDNRYAGERIIFDFGVASFPLHNNAGDATRPTIIGEVARRDPQWLAGFALQRMAADYLPERAAGFRVFRELTGRSCGFDVEAFHAARQPALRELQTWWGLHGHESRDEWLLTLFAERGFKLERLDDRSAIPTLVAALDADPITHTLAVEQLAIITDLLFDVRSPSSHRDQEYTTVMVTGKLRARGWLTEEVPARE